MYSCFFEHTKSGQNFKQRHEELQKELIDKFMLKIQNGLIGIDDAINRDGNSLLLFVASSNDIASLKWLVENGASIHIKNNHSGYSALHIATQSNQLEIVQFLLEKTDVPVDIPAHDGATPLLLAIIKHDERLIDLFIKKGANVDSVTQYSRTDYTLLEYFVCGVCSNNPHSDNLKSMEILLGLNVTITSRAIEAVIRQADLESLKLLIKYGASFTKDLLNLATVTKDYKKVSVEARRNQLDSERDLMSVEEINDAIFDLNGYEERLQVSHEIEALIRAGLKSCIEQKQLVSTHIDDGLIVKGFLIKGGDSDDREQKYLNLIKDELFLISILYKKENEMIVLFTKDYSALKEMPYEEAKQIIENVILEPDFKPVFARRFGILNVEPASCQIMMNI